MNYPLQPTIPTRFEDEYPEAAAHLISFYPDTSKDALPRSRWLPKTRLPIHPASRTSQAINQEAIYDRNARCECGSGLKQKKCCMLLKSPADPQWWSMRITNLEGKPVDLYLDSTMVVHTPKPKPAGHFLTQEYKNAFIYKPRYQREKRLQLSVLMYAACAISGGRY